MEKFRETSLWGREQGFLAGTILTVLLAWLFWLTWRYCQSNGGLGEILYVIAFLGLWAWRYAFQYTYILTDKALLVMTAGLGINRKMSVDLSSIETFADRYHKKFFRRTGIKKYIYRYSSGDPRPIRIAVFCGDGRRQAVLFRVSDRFIDQMKMLIPEKLLDKEKQ